MKFLGRVKKSVMHVKLHNIITRKRVYIAVGIFIAFLLLTPMLTYAYFARDISDRQRLMNRNNTGVVLKDRNGTVFYEYGKINGNDDVPLDQISDNLENALVASEDKNFYKHEGYSLRGIAGALYANILNSDATKYGGSTITQQLVKNKLLSSNKNYLRKYQEISMAIAVERRYTKGEIIEMYLNSVYFGEGAFGVADAAKTYYNKSPADLTVAESAMLVGILPAPNAFSPISGDSASAKKYQQRVINELIEQKYITKTAGKSALDEKIAYSGGQTASFDSAQHYALMVLDELYAKYGEERVSRSGFEVTTGLDLNFQKQAEATVKKRVAQFSSQGGRNAGLVAIDPRNGQVRSLVGSVNWDDDTFGKVNMALSPRQPGSSFKPIYYSEAIDKRIITAATILKDQPRTFGDWTPQNYDFRFRGNISVRNALALSLNIPSADVMQKLGVEQASAAARRMGVSTITEPEKYGLTLALGTAETKLFEMVNAYAAFANKGYRYDPVLITAIEDKYDNEVFKLAKSDGKQVISEQAAFVISNIIADNNARAATFGSSLNVSNRQVAVKTGTTNDNKDAWTIGYTPSISLGVWVGNNENQPMRGLAGGSSAGLIWRETMTSYLQTLPNEKFEPPSGIRPLAICRGTELRAVQGSDNVFTEYFIAGTEPSGTCQRKAPVERREEEVKEEKDEDNPAEEIPVEEPLPDPANPPVTEEPPVTDEGASGGRGRGSENTPPPEPNPPSDEPRPTTPPQPPAQ